MLSGGDENDDVIKTESQELASGYSIIELHSYKNDSRLEKSIVTDPIDTSIQNQEKIFIKEDYCEQILTKYVQSIRKKPMKCKKCHKKHNQLQECTKKST